MLSGQLLLDTIGTRDLEPENIDSGPMCITNLFQNKSVVYFNSGIPEFRPFGQKGKFSAFGLRFRPPKLKAEYGRNSRKALDFFLFVHENIANVNYQW